MMSAYSELYIDDAACNLGEYLDYMTNQLKYNIDKAFEMLAYSSVGRQFEQGNPKYVTGMSGVELAIHTIYQVTGIWESSVGNMECDRSPQYWVGWAIAHFQWKKCISFRKMIENSLTASLVEQNYILHEADITKFYDWADRIVTVEYEPKDDGQSALRRLRKYHKMTQKELSEKSGVSLRMVQLYEQGQNDISKAQAWVVYSLAVTLGTTTEELLSHVR